MVDPTKVPVCKPCLKGDTLRPLRCILNLQNTNVNFDLNVLYSTYHFKCKIKNSSLVVIYRLFSVFYKYILKLFYRYSRVPMFFF